MTFVENLKREETLWDLRHLSAILQQGSGRSPSILTVRNSLFDSIAAKEMEKTQSSMLNVTLTIDTQPDPLNSKKFSSKAFSFGLGRHEVFKTHVNEVY